MGLFLNHGVVPSTFTALAAVVTAAVVGVWVEEGGRDAVGVALGRGLVGRPC